MAAAQLEAHTAGPWVELV